MSLPEEAYYASYLKLDTLLNAQKPVSKAHEEMIFIVVHQVTELWFAQVLHDLKSVQEILGQSRVSDEGLNTAVHRLERVKSIIALTIQHLDILETMTPLDFLEFRHLISPASGFQSFQFRLLGIRLGLPEGARLGHAARLEPQHQEALKAAESEKSLFTLVERWLERTPYLQWGDFSFWDAYRKAVTSMLERDRKTIENHRTLTSERKKLELAEFERTQKSFDALLDAKKYEELQKSGVRRISQKASQAALLIQLYRDQPLFQNPHRLLTLLIDLDETLASWMHRHALMVSRMIGTKIGTGGSSGHQYLMNSLEKHKIFGDLSGLSTFLIPRSQLPALPKSLAKNLGFIEV